MQMLLPFPVFVCVCVCFVSVNVYLSVCLSMFMFDFYVSSYVYTVEYSIESFTLLYAVCALGQKSPQINLFQMRLYKLLVLLVGGEKVLYTKRMR